MVLSYENSTIKTGLMRIRQGISKVIYYLLFSSVWLLILQCRVTHRTGYRYWMSTGCAEFAKRQHVSHLLYMDDPEAVWQKF